MPDQLIRCTPHTQNGATTLMIEGLQQARAWRPLAQLRPDVRFTGRDTLNLDVFAPKLAWQTAVRKQGVLLARGSDGGVRLTTLVTVHSHDMLRVETRLSFRRPVRLEYARDVLQCATAPLPRIWAPLQTPLPEMLVGDLAFHTPLLCTQTEHACLALIANTRVLASHRRVPVALACDAARGLLSCGCVPYRLAHETYCVHYDTDTADVNGVLTYSYFLYYQNDCRPGEGLRRAAHRVWQLYAVTRAQSAAPQTRPFEEARPSARTIAPQTAHDAYAAALAAQRVNDEAAFARARSVITDVLNTPQRDGLFACAAPYGPPGHETLCRVANCSWTCYWLCRWHNDIAEDARIPAFVTRYAERLCALQKRGGFVPAWIDPQSGRTARWCVRSAETAVHVIFLAALQQLAPDPRWEKAARRAINFIIRAIAAPGRWECTETFWHASPAWKAKRPGRTDPRQGTFAAHVLALWWSAEALLQLYTVTGTPRYLSWGERVLDELSLYQQVWDAPFLAVPSFGGVAASNTDVQWNSIAQALCAKTFLDYYRACGLTEYFQRGVAALRAQYGVVERTQPRPGAAGEDLLPLLNGSAPGDLPSAYMITEPAHPRTDMLATPLWQLGPWTALCAAECIWREYGDLYVDTRRAQAFGINGVVVERTQKDLAGVAVYGRELLGAARTLTVRTDTGATFHIKVKAGAAFELQV